MNFAPISIPTLGDVPSTDAQLDIAPDNSHVCDDVAEIPADISPKHDHINVYVDSATATGVVSGSPLVAVDVVLNVSINNPENGSYSSYKIIKRISFDKIKLALQAETETPFQVVEGEAVVAARKEAEKAEQKAAMQAHQLSRIRAMAGLE